MGRLCRILRSRDWNLQLSIIEAEDQEWMDWTLISQIEALICK